MRLLVIVRSALVAAVLALAASPVVAASAEEDYLAARDAAIAGFKALEDQNRVDDAAMKAHDEAVADLERRMRAVLGPVPIKGLPGAGKINFDTLFPSDQGFGTLDGLVFAAADDKTRVIATTETLFARWLRGHKGWWGDKIANVPQEPAAAIKSDAFYTQAIQTDAAVMRFAELPLARPATAKFLFAMLAARSQDEAPRAPDEIFVTVMQGGRLFVASAPVRRKFAAVPACDAIRRRQLKAAEAAYDAYAAGGLKDEKQFDRSTSLRRQADTLFLRCFSGEAAKQPAFAAATKQAQSLLESLPLR
jgi:hypothetical protein